MSVNLPPSSTCPASCHGPQLDTFPVITKSAEELIYADIDTLHAELVRRLRTGYTWTMRVAEALPVMVERIVRNFEPERIILFGSQARGDARPDSDVDLIVVMGDEATDRRRMAVDIRVSLADVLVPMDILVATPGDLARRGQVNGSVLRPALVEGRVLYERP